MCQCLPGFGGPECEKLLSVNFVDRDTYLQFTDLQNWPRANITLQVRAQGARSQRGVGQVRAAGGGASLPRRTGRSLCNQNSLDMGPADVGRLLGHKSNLRSGKGVGEWSRAAGSSPATLTGSSAPAFSAAHSPRGWDTAGVGPRLQLWPCIFSLLALGPLFCCFLS